MKAKDLLSFGFAVDVWDEDVSSNDLIAPKGPLTVTESDLLLGSMTGITNKVTLLNLKIAFQKQYVRSSSRWCVRHYHDVAHARGGPPGHRRGSSSGP